MTNHQIIDEQGQSYESLPEKQVREDLAIAGIITRTCKYVYNIGLEQYARVVGTLHEGALRMLELREREREIKKTVIDNNPPAA